MAAYVQLLGTPLFRLEGECLEPSPGKSSALLYYLAYQGRWVSRDELLYLFWPDSDEEPIDWQAQVHAYEADLVGGGRGGVGPSHCCSGAVTEWMFISAGTGGERAPRPAGDPPPAEDEWSRAQVAFNATGNGVAARGSVVLNDPDRGMTFRSTTLGKLQVADGWASLTGRGAFAGMGDERAFTLILDEHDSLEGGATTVSVDIDGGYRIKGVLDRGASGT
jgi:hypothetical protein